MVVWYQTTTTTHDKSWNCSSLRQRQKKKLRGISPRHPSPTVALYETHRVRYRQKKGPTSPSFFFTLVPMRPPARRDRGDRACGLPHKRLMLRPSVRHATAFVSKTMSVKKTVQFLFINYMLKDDERHYLNSTECTKHSEGLFLKRKPKHNENSCCDRT